MNAQSAVESAADAVPPRLKDRYDAVIIGGGHNGLVCACYLAGAGLKVAVFERRGVVGGAAVTEEFHPGFRNSTASYTVSLLHPKVIHELCLKEHGLKIVERPMSNFLPLPGGEYLKVGGATIDGRGGTQAEVARFSHKDAAALPAYYAMLERVADVLRALLLETPPNVGGGVHELFQAWKVGGKLKRLPMAQRRDILDLFTKSAGDILDRWFESDPIKAALGFDAVVGNFASPYTPGSAYVLLHHVFGEVNGKRGQWGHAFGGMGAITQAMAREALGRGVEIFTDEAVARVLTRDGSAVGIVLADGSEVAAPRDRRQRQSEAPVPPADRCRRRSTATSGSGSRTTAAPPRRFASTSRSTPFPTSPACPATAITCARASSLRRRSPTWSAPISMRASTAGRASPSSRLLIPSLVDRTLAPPGKHVASLFCQHANPTLPDGRSWDAVRDEVADLMIATVNRHAPNFAASVLGRRVLSPLDLEREFGLIGGDIFHGALSLDQLFSARPVLGNGHYRGPLKGLYMCGAGTHPGGGVTGVPGHNAAREILRDLRRRRHG